MPTKPKPKGKDAAAKTEKRPVGRPGEYRPEMCDALIAHMGKGGSFTSFAGEIGMHRGTLDRWTKEHTEFSDAYKTACARFEQYMLAQGEAMMLGQLTITYMKTFMVNGVPMQIEVTEPTKGVQKIWDLKMKNIAKWRDNRDVTVAGDQDKPLVSRGETLEEKKARVEAMRKARLEVEGK